MKIFPGFTTKLGKFEAIYTTQGTTGYEISINTPAGTHGVVTVPALAKGRNVYLDGRVVGASLLNVTQPVPGYQEVSFGVDGGGTHVVSVR
jgi:hypothetical protein